jgi:hypothetical protein
VHDLIIQSNDEQTLEFTLQFNSLATPAFSLTLGVIARDNSFIPIQSAAHVGVAYPSDNTTIALSVLARILSLALSGMKLIFIT